MSTPFSTVTLNYPEFKSGHQYKDYLNCNELKHLNKKKKTIKWFITYIVHSYISWAETLGQLFCI